MAFTIDPVILKNYQVSFGRLVVNAWLDPILEERFRGNPAAVMEEFGIVVPAGMKLRADELMLPPKPAADVIEYLQNSTGAKDSCLGSASSFSCPGCTAGTAGSGLCHSEVLSVRPEKL
jgi:hypothetical protein